MADKKVALITGITGQDGSYMAELLLSKGYEVHGLVRRVSSFNTGRINHLHHPESDTNKLKLHYGDLSDASSLIKIIDLVQPDEVYNFAAQSHVRISFDTAEATTDVTGLGALRLLEALRLVKKNAKFYQASSSEMFGKVLETPQKETTPFNPRSPYAIAKVFAHSTAVNYREAFGMFVVGGILFNHESPRRGENFVTRKITKSIAKILKGDQAKLRLGNLDAKRDWGYAPEYVDAAWLMMQQAVPEDYVIATGETHSVREFLEAAFNRVSIKDWNKYIEIDPLYYRPTEVDILIGDYSKAKAKLGWEPKTKFKDLVDLMVEADCKELGVKI